MMLYQQEPEKLTQEEKYNFQTFENSTKRTRAFIKTIEKNYAKTKI